MSVEIKGTVEEIIFQNEDNGFCIAIIDHNNELVFVKGIIPIIEIGQMMSFLGDYVTDPKYGEQFNVESSQIILPTDEDGIELFLASGFIDGIGPAYAERIVKAFGKDTLDIIQYNPDKLLEIDGIGEKTLEKVTTSYIEKMAMKEVVIFLQKYGVSTTFATRIYDVYEEKSIPMINKNPYRLADDINGIGFVIADRIAKKMGVESESPFRIASGIKHVLKESQNEGHTFLYKETLVYRSARMLHVDDLLIDSEIQELLIKRGLILQMIEGKEAVYLPYLAEAESYVANKLIQLNNAFYRFPIDIEEELKAINEALGISLHDLQEEAIRESLNNGVLVITGGPGTGKTTIINSIIKMFNRNDYKVLLAAPTGRAAKRMTETTGKEAKTIHRLLEYTKGSDNFLMFNKTMNDPLVCDVLIIDETSMVDISLMKNLLEALTEGTRLVLVGDADQLPSVGPGNVLRHIIESEIIKTVTLNKIFRQSEESLIVTNAHKINQGKGLEYNMEGKDFFFIKRKRHENILNELKSLCGDRLKDFIDVDPLEDIQILTPMKNHLLGTRNINKVLQETLNPPDKFKNEKEFRDQIFRVGDKVMQIKNNYDVKWQKNDGEEGIGIFNGDMGYIYGIDTYDKELLITFDQDKNVRYSFNSLKELIHSYAITIHKSQGNEFPVVILPMSWIPNMLSDRKILYTAITRAKKLVVIVGEEKYLMDMINNERNLVRNSGLKERIIKRNDLTLL